MGRESTTHLGPSWSELAASYHGRQLYALIVPKPGTGGKKILLKVTLLSNFRSGSMFFVDGTTPDGQKVELQGYGSHRSEDPCTFEVRKVS